MLDAAPVRGGVRPQTLVLACADALRRGGADPTSARHVASAIVDASLRGVDSHGVRLLPHYLRVLKSGRINPNPTLRFERKGASVGVLDADDGFGHRAAVEAMTHAMDLARETGAGHVSVRSSSHCGALATYVLQASRAGMIGMAMTHASPNTRAPNSREPLVSTNPMAIAAPGLDDDHFCYDGSQTPISFNEVRRRRLAGEPLPPGACADRQGLPTTDADQAVQLLPIGAHKGFGLAIAVDLFCGALSGSPMGPDISKMFADWAAPRRIGHYVSALNIARFIDLDQFRAAVSAYAGLVRTAAPLDPAQPSLFPGDKERLAAKARAVSGLRLDAEVLDALGPSADLLEQTSLDPI